MGRGHLKHWAIKRIGKGLRNSQGKGRGSGGSGTLALTGAGNSGSTGTLNCRVKLDRRVKAQLEGKEQIE